MACCYTRYILDSRKVLRTISHWNYWKSLISYLVNLVKGVHASCWNTIRNFWTPQNGSMQVMIILIYFNIINIF